MKSLLLVLSQTNLHFFDFVECIIENINVVWEKGNAETA